MDSPRRMLRTLIAIVATVAATAFVVGFFPGAVLYRGDELIGTRAVVEHANWLLGVLALYLVPGAVIWRRPRIAHALLWSMWSVALTVLVVIATFDHSDLAPGMIMLWPSVVFGYLMSSLLFLLIAVMPIACGVSWWLARTRTARPVFPRARVVKLVALLLVGCGSGKPKPPPVVLDDPSSTPTPTATPVEPPPAPEPEPTAPTKLSDDELETPAKGTGEQEGIAWKSNADGIALVRAAKFADASAKFRDAVARVPHAAYFFNLSVALYREGKYGEALTACNAIANNDPTAALTAKADAQRNRILWDAKQQQIDVR